MYLLYIDASGKPELTNHTPPHYTLAGICINSADRDRVKETMDQLAKKWTLDQPLELHAKDICRTIGEQDDVPDFDALDPAERNTRTLAVMHSRLAKKADSERASYKSRIRSLLPIIHLNRAQRSALYEEALDAIGKLPIVVFIDAVDKQLFLKKHGLAGQQPSSDAFQHLVGRFVGYLKRKSSDGKRERGRLLMDNDPADERLFRDLHRQYCDSGHRLGPIEGIIKKPRFVDSQRSRGVQIADLVSYCARRYVENYQKKDRNGVCHEEKQFRRIFHLLDRHNGLLHSRHNTGKCGCLICQERGFQQ